MNKSAITQSELDKVQEWIDKKRNENVEFDEEYRRTKDMKFIVNKQRNSEQICMAEKFLAEQRAFNHNQQTQNFQ